MLVINITVPGIGKIVTPRATKYNTVQSLGFKCLWDNLTTVATSVTNSWSHICACVRVCVQCVLILSTSHFLQIQPPWEPLTLQIRPLTWSFQWLLLLWINLWGLRCVSFTYCHNFSACPSSLHAVFSRHGATKAPQVLDLPPNIFSSCCHFCTMSVGSQLSVCVKDAFLRQAVPDLLV